MPIWESRVLSTERLVLVSQLLDLLPVTALLEHFVGPLFIERTAHPLVRGLLCENCRATQPLALPYAVLDHSCEIIGVVCS